MAVEIGVVCLEIPDAEQVSRLVGPLMSVALRIPLIHTLVDDQDGCWKLMWATTSVVVDRLPPGRHEYADRWFLTVAAGERAIDLSLLLTFMTAASIAIVGDGRIIDDAKLAGGGEFSGGDLLTRAAAGGGPERSVQEVLAALGVQSWSE
jgi:hypothetical protein